MSYPSLEVVLPPGHFPLPLVFSKFVGAALSPQENVLSFS